MRSGTVRAEVGDDLSVPGSALGGPAWRGFRAVDRAIALAHVSDVLDAADAGLDPADVLAAVCEVVAPHLRLAHAVLFKRVAGQSRAIAWSPPDAPASSRTEARDRAWTRAASFLETGAANDEALGAGMTVSLRDARLGLSAVLYVESHRALDEGDDGDRGLLEELLRRMLALPEDRRRR